jgi:hypothetical protein
MDSIKDLAFTSKKYELADNVQYLASCSQDHNIRMWKI